MALKWRRGLAFIECDTCDDTIESNQGESFDDFTDRRKKPGWTAKPVSGGRDYTHGCPKHGA
ncbi:hypothetical protein ABIF68_005924 [Bradyrhizobium japonicum]|uniref:hypothetical protein n=1 Tax=Bradyrhizobium sp. Mp27 TaxID=3042157 RepID=UPI00248C408E|nr:hypothetical protein [Bradyrhizobium sp. Mp27]MDI2078201.1 hypothetical protein [Bradyrhizobium sp. Mp27]